MNGLRTWFGRTQYRGRHNPANMPPPYVPGPGRPPGRGRTALKYGPTGKPARTREQLADRESYSHIPVTNMQHKTPAGYRSWGGQRTAAPSMGQGWFG